MKILTPEEERAHTRETYKGGFFGAAVGLAATSLGVWGASRRFHAFRQLSVPFRVFLVTSSTTFTGVISADHYSRNFEKRRHADSDFKTQSEQAASELSKDKSTGERMKAFVSEQRYPIVFSSWLASMAIALGLVGRSPHMTGQQKLVQARVYAQGLTLAVLIASFMLEGSDMRAGKGRWETVKVLDPDDPEHKRMIEKKIHHEAYTGQDQWMDMIESQEAKMKSKGERIYDSKKAKKDSNH
ncbi:MAG: hypothetical protein M1828_005927 [Chrysothrix sp. TS-e1954]|nr:MAG: hypothetical protein M1828_005927 [Chrysothrix sp. TS-e1954]